MSLPEGVHDERPDGEHVGAFLHGNDQRLVEIEAERGKSSISVKKIMSV